MSQDEEHNTVLREYSHIVNLVPNSDQITVKTDEGKQFDTKWTPNGWICGDSSYEVFETMLMNQSPSFKQKFFQIVSDKLQATSQ